MRRELLRAAARMYYLEDLSQQVIADQLQVSRSSVSRMLTEAREVGVVRIAVEPPAMSAELGRKLTARLGLRDVLVVPSGVGRSEPWADLASGLAQALNGLALEPGSVLLTAWSRTIWEVSAHEITALPGVVVAPMMAAANEIEPWFETNAITRRVATTLGASPQFLHAPVHPSAGLREELLRDPETRQTLQLWDVADACLVSVGAPPTLRADYGPRHHARSRDQLARAAGDVASRYFDVEGQPVAYEDEELLLGISREQLANVPHRIAIAIGGEKVVSIVGASRGRLINILVTDETTARLAFEHVETVASQGRAS